MIEAPRVQWSALAPELILLAAASILLVVAVVTRGRTQRLISVGLGGVAFAAAAIAAISIWDFGGGDWRVFEQQLRVDRFGNGARVLIALAGLLTVLISLSWEHLEERSAEYVALLLLAAMGMNLLAVSNSLIALFVALELFSVTLYALCALNMRSPFSLESSLKYLVMGSVGSAVLLYGSALLYGATGSLRFDQIAEALRDGGDTDALALAGTAMLLTGLAFKVSAVPFHMWTPDVYEGAPTAVTAFMASATKAAAFTALFRVLVDAVPAHSDVWQPVMAALSILSLIVGNVAALAQTNIKRMLAYSSIGQAGYLLTALAAGTAFGGESLLFYLAVYVAMTMGAFAVIAVRERETREPVTLDSLRGWGFSRPVLAGIMAVCLLSLGGFPLTGGFYGKLLVFRAAVDADLTYLAVVGVVATAISLGYYLRVGFVLFDRRPDPSGYRLRSAPGTMPAVAAGAFTVVVLLWLGVYPGGAMDWVQDAAESLAAAR
jgi:NADH-quinone oxidoreductase subunit N